MEARKAAPGTDYLALGLSNNNDDPLAKAEKILEFRTIMGRLRDGAGSADDEARARELYPIAVGAYNSKDANEGTALDGLRDGFWRSAINQTIQGFQGFGAGLADLVGADETAAKWDKYADIRATRADFGDRRADGSAYDKIGEVLGTAAPTMLGLAAAGMTAGTSLAATVPWSVGSYFGAQAFGGGRQMVREAHGGEASDVDEFIGGLMYGSAELLAEKYGFTLLRGIGAKALAQTASKLRKTAEAVNPSALKTLVKAMPKAIALSSAENAVEEGVTEYMNNLTDRFITAIDPDGSLLDGIGSAALNGALLGPIAGPGAVLSNNAGRRRIVRRNVDSVLGKGSAKSGADVKYSMLDDGETLDGHIEVMPVLDGSGDARKDRLSWRLLNSEGLVVKKSEPNGQASIPNLVTDLLNNDIRIPGFTYATIDANMSNTAILDHVKKRIQDEGRDDEKLVTRLNVAGSSRVIFGMDALQTQLYTLEEDLRRVEARNKLEAEKAAKEKAAQAAKEAGKATKGKKDKNPAVPVAPVAKQAPAFATQDEADAAFAAMSTGEQVVPPVDESAPTEPPGFGTFTQSVDIPQPPEITAPNSFFRGESDEDHIATILASGDLRPGTNLGSSFTSQSIEAGITIVYDGSTAKTTKKGYNPDEAIYERGGVKPTAIVIERDFFIEPRPASEIDALEPEYNRLFAELQKKHPDKTSDELTALVDDRKPDASLDAEDQATVESMLSIFRQWDEYRRDIDNGTVYKSFRDRVAALSQHGVPVYSFERDLDGDESPMNWRAEFTPEQQSNKTEGVDNVGNQVAETQDQSIPQVAEGVGDEGGIDPFGGISLDEEGAETGEAIEGQTPERIKDQAAIAPFSGRGKKTVQERVDELIDSGHTQLTDDGTKLTNPVSGKSVTLKQEMDRLYAALALREKGEAEEAHSKFIGEVKRGSIVGVAKVDGAPALPRRVVKKSSTGTFVLDDGSSLKGDALVPVGDMAGASEDAKAKFSQMEALFDQFDDLNDIIEPSRGASTGDEHAANVSTLVRELRESNPEKAASVEEAYDYLREAASQLFGINDKQGDYSRESNDLVFMLAQDMLVPESVAAQEEEVAPEVTTVAQDAIPVLTPAQIIAYDSITRRLLDKPGSRIKRTQNLYSMGTELGNIVDIAKVDNGWSVVDAETDRAIAPPFATLNDASLFAKSQSDEILGDRDLGVEDYLIEKTEVAPTEISDSKTADKDAEKAISKKANKQAISEAAAVEARIAKATEEDIAVNRKKVAFSKPASKKGGAGLVIAKYFRKSNLEDPASARMVIRWAQIMAELNGENGLTAGSAEAKLAILMFENEAFTAEGRSLFIGELTDDRANIVDKTLKAYQAEQTAIAAPVAGASSKTPAVNPFPASTSVLDETGTQQDRDEFFEGVPSTMRSDMDISTDDLLRLGFLVTEVDKKGKETLRVPPEMKADIRDRLKGTKYEMSKTEVPTEMHVLALAEAGYVWHAGNLVRADAAVYDNIADTMSRIQEIVEAESENILGKEGARLPISAYLAKKIETTGSYKVDADLDRLITLADKLSVVQRQMAHAGNNLLEELSDEGAYDFAADADSFLDEETGIDDVPRLARASKDSVMHGFHVAGRAVYGDEWDARRPVIVAQVSQGAQTSSAKLTIAQLSAATKILKGEGTPSPTTIASTFQSAAHANSDPTIVGEDAHQRHASNEHEYITNGAASAEVQKWLTGNKVTIDGDAPIMFASTTKTPGHQRVSLVEGDLDGGGFSSVRVVVKATNPIDSLFTAQNITVKDLVAYLASHGVEAADQQVAKAIEILGEDAHDFSDVLEALDSYAEIFEAYDSVVIRDDAGRVKDIVVASEKQIRELQDVSPVEETPAEVLAKEETGKPTKEDVNKTMRVAGHVLTTYLMQNPGLRRMAAVLVPTEADLPSRMALYAEAAGGARAVYDPLTRSTYFVASHFAHRAENVLPVFLHEYIAHFGIPGYYNGIDKEAQAEIDKLDRESDAVADKLRQLYEVHKDRITELHAQTMSNDSARRDELLNIDGSIYQQQLLMDERDRLRKEGDAFRRDAGIADLGNRWAAISDERIALTKSATIDFRDRVWESHKNSKLMDRVRQDNDYLDDTTEIGRRILAEEYIGAMIESGVKDSMIDRIVGNMLFNVNKTGFISDRQLRYVIHSALRDGFSKKGRHLLAIRESKLSNMSGGDKENLKKLIKDDIESVDIASRAYGRTQDESVPRFSRGVYKRGIEKIRAMESMDADEKKAYMDKEVANFKEESREGTGILGTLNKYRRRYFTATGRRVSFVLDRLDQMGETEAYTIFDDISRALDVRAGNEGSTIARKARPGDTLRDAEASYNENREYHSHLLTNRLYALMDEGDLDRGRFGTLKLSDAAAENHRNTVREITRGDLRNQSARDITELLDDIWTYMKAAGVTKGIRKVKNYFPRIFDQQAIEKDPDGFTEALTAAMVAKGAEHEDAARFAIALEQSILLDNSSAIDKLISKKGGIGDEFTRLGILDKMPKNTPWFLSHRRLNIDYESIDQYMDTNIGRVMNRYIQRSVSYTEMVKKLGPDLGSSKIQRLVSIHNKLGKDSPYTADDVALLRNMILATQGQYQADSGVANDRNLSRAIALMEDATSMSVMGLVLFSAVSEFGAPIIRMGTSGLKGLFSLPGVVTQRKNHSNNILARELGLVSEAAIEEIMEAFTYANTSTVRPLRGWVSLFYKYNGLSAITRLQRNLATGGARIHVREMLEAQELTPRQERDARHLGLPTGANERAGMLAWLNSLEAVSEDARTAFKSGEHEATWDRYGIAVQRLVRETIIHPTASTKPLYMSSRNPLVRLAGQLQGFSASFREGPVAYLQEEITASKGEEERWAMLLRLLPFMLLTWLIPQIKYELLYGISEEDQDTLERIKNERGVVDFIGTVAQSGIAGQASRAFGLFESYKYGVDGLVRSYSPTAVRTSQLLEAFTNWAEGDDRAISRWLTRGVPFAGQVPVIRRPLEQTMQAVLPGSGE